MKYILYTILAIVGLILFLPEPGSTQIRNIPILIFIILCVAVYLIYRLIRLVSLQRKIKKVIISCGMEIGKSRILLGSGYIVAKSGDKNICVRCFVRRHKLCRYHFASDDIIEFYKSSMAMVKKSSSGAFAKGAVETRKVGELDLCSVPDSYEFARSILVIDKMPDMVSDYKSNKILFDGDVVGDGNMIFISFDKFTELVNNYEA